MGAVLMILGELGFVGVYVGGGISIQVDDFTQKQYFTLPEWGAMMAGARAWARSRPWMARSTPAQTRTGLAWLRCWR